jgi:hypothetical protein
MKKIDKKIVGYSVKDVSKKDNIGTKEIENSAPLNEKADVIRMHEKLERPEMLIGSTYKVKTPISDHAMYVTINDIVLNKDTEHEKKKTF